MQFSKVNKLHRTSLNILRTFSLTTHKNKMVKKKPDQLSVLFSKGETLPILARLVIILFHYRCLLSLLCNALGKEALFCCFLC